MNNKIFKIIHPGLYTSFQDLGRRGLESWGISSGGAMDTRLAQEANLAVHNPIHYPVLEFFQIPPRFYVLHPCEIAVTGITIKLIINNQEIGQKAKVYPGQHINIKLLKGCYGYLAINGLFTAKKDFGSYSHHQLAKLGSPRLTKEDIISANLSNQKKSTTNANIKKIKIQSSSVKVHKGPEYHLLSEQLQKTLIQKTYLVKSTANRMAIPLQITDPLPHQIKIISSPVLTGTIQLPPNGQPIVLGKDCQTIGGYPRIFSICSNDLRIVFQTPAEQTFKIYLSK